MRRTLLAALVPVAACLWLLHPSTGARAAPHPQTPASPGFHISASSFSASGSEGVVLTSTGFRLTLMAMGEAAPTPGVLAGTSFRMEGGLACGNTPPGEVQGLRFSDADHLSWLPHAPAIAYHIYRDAQCLDTREVETSVDTTTPPSGDVFHYLITAENRLSEEGTTGFESSGAVRPTPNACP